MHRTIGWIGAALLALCAVPQAAHSLITGEAEDLNWLFLSMWGWGEVLLLWYILPTKDWPLIVNYIFNIICILIIVGVKL